jgi:hypothetical protein
MEVWGCWETNWMPDCPCEMGTLATCEEEGML